MDARLNAYVEKTLAGRAVSDLSAAELGGFVRSLFSAVSVPSEDEIDAQIDAILTLERFTQGEGVSIAGIELPSGRVMRNLQRTATTDLTRLYAAKGRITDAMAKADELYEEAKKQDDTALTLTAAVLQAEIYLASGAISKARGAYIAAQAAAAKIYVKPHVQCALDALGGALSAEESDSNTAISFFTEAFDNASSTEIRTMKVAPGKQLAPEAEVEAADARAQAVLALCASLVERVRGGKAEDVAAALSTKSVLPFVSEPAVASIEVLCRATFGSISEFQAAKAAWEAGLDEFAPFSVRRRPATVCVTRRIAELERSIIRTHIANALRAYTRVPLDRLARLAGLDKAHLEAEMAEMVLDGVVSASIEQDTGLVRVLDLDEVTEKARTRTLAAARTALSEIEETARAIEARTAAVRTAFRGEAVVF